MNNEEKPTVVMIDKRIAISGALIDMFKGHMQGWNFLAFSNVPEAIDQTYSLNEGQKLFLLNVGGIELSKGSLEEHVNSLRQGFPNVPIVILADNEELLNLNLFSYLKLNGFMTTSIAPEVLAAVMKLVIVGGVYIPEKLVLKLSYDKEKLPVAYADNTDSSEQVAELNNFTPRQREVLELLHYGLSNKVIADRLNICESTVKVHMTGIMKKLEVTNRTQAAYFVSKLFGQEAAPALL
jgi:DNA-binding NarL/FixJ family response regulator